MPPEQRTIRAIVRELIDNPFFPILFFSETVKTFVQNGYVVDWVVLNFLVLGLLFTIVWVLSDSISVDVEVKSIIGYSDNGSEDNE